jgi:RNA polymerase sigma-54 factor
VREAADLIIGNLNEDGYLIASDDELMGTTTPATPEMDAVMAENVFKEAAALGLGESAQNDADLGVDDGAGGLESSAPVDDLKQNSWQSSSSSYGASTLSAATAVAPAPAVKAPEATVQAPAAPAMARPVFRPTFSLADLHEALEVVRQLDPPGVACRDLRECLLYQLRYHQQQLAAHKNGNGEASSQLLNDAVVVVDQHLRAVTNKQFKEISRAMGRPVEAIQSALDYVRTLDPRPGLRYNKVQPRLIEPDVAFVKHGDEWLVVMNE